MLAFQCNEQVAGLDGAGVGGDCGKLAVLAGKFAVHSGGGFGKAHHHDHASSAFSATSTSEKCDFCPSASW
jgi:hypothetical protein